MKVSVLSFHCKNRFPAPICYIQPRSNSFQLRLRKSSPISFHHDTPSTLNSRQKYYFSKKISISKVTRQRSILDRYLLFPSQMNFLLHIEVSFSRNLVYAMRQNFLDHPQTCVSNSVSRNRFKTFWTLKETLKMIMVNFLAIFTYTECRVNKSRHKANLVD